MSSKGTLKKWNTVLSDMDQLGEDRELGFHLNP